MSARAFAAVAVVLILAGCFGARDENAAAPREIGTASASHLFTDAGEHDVLNVPAGARSIVIRVTFESIATLSCANEDARIAVHDANGNVLVDERPDSAQMSTGSCRETRDAFRGPVPSGPFAVDFTGKAALQGRVDVIGFA